MKYVNLFDEFLNEEYKHVNNNVIQYKQDIINLIEKNDLSINKIDILTDLNNREFLKLSNFKIIVDINSDDFKNSGFFRKSNDSKIENSCLTNCLLYLQMNLSEEEIKNNKISHSNKIHSLINHELNHGLEVYQYEYNNRRYRFSWELAKKQRKHREFSDKYEYWKDFNYLIYLGLNHEMSSRISEIYEDIKNYKDIEIEIKNNKIYKDAEFMSNFNFDTFYKLFIDKYGEKEFLSVCEKFCFDFEYNFKDDLKYCKNIIKRIINSFNRKGKKILRKIKNIIKRVEQEKNGIVFEGYYNNEINYDKYDN